MSEELASVQEVVDLSPEGALNRAKTFLVGKGYREVKRSGNSLTVERFHPDRHLKGSVLTLWIAALPQPGGGVRITVRGNDRAGVHDQQNDWIDWANSLPKKASANRMEVSTAQVEPQNPTEEQEPKPVTVEEVEEYFYSPSQLASLVSVSVNKMIYAGKLPMKAIEGKYWIPEEIADDLIRKHPRRKLKGPKDPKPKPRRFVVSKKVQTSTTQESSEASVPESLESMKTPIKVDSFLIHDFLGLPTAGTSTPETPVDEIKEPQSAVSTPEAMLRTEQEGKERLAQELEHEREKHEKTNLDAQREISQLEAEITKLRSDLESEWAQTTENATRAEEFQAQLVEERNRRLAAEKLASVFGPKSVSRDEYERQLAAMRLEIENMQREYTAEIKVLEEDLEEERTKRTHVGRRADTLEDELLTPKTSWQSDRELELEHELTLEREGRKQDALDAQYEIDQLSAELENTRRDGGQSLTLREELAEEKTKRSNSEERLTDLMSKLENNEAKRKDLEKTLSLLQRKVHQLEEETSVLNAVRRLLSAESRVQITPTEDVDSPKPPIEDTQLHQELLLETPFGQSAFRPPFTLTDREVELLRLVAREHEITAEQIRKQMGRRAVEDLNELLDRLEIEGMNPVKEINDRYSFHPDNLPS